MERNEYNEAEQLYDYWFCACVPMRRERKHALLAQGVTARTLFSMKEEELSSSFRLRDEEMAALTAGRSLPFIRQQMNEMRERGLAYYPIFHPSFPQRLRLIPDPPIGIWAAGALPDPQLRTVGVVGARMCTEYGRKLAQMLGERLAGAGWITVSGMALGVDSASHAGALRGQGQTIAVLGSGADVCYPRSSRGIYEQIRGGGGAVISEYPPGTQPRAENFPVRNRIISGLSDVLIVVEARKRSGSLITVDCALEQGKTIYAVPGRYDDPLSIGCNTLIAQGAGILYDIDAVLEDIAGGSPLLQEEADADTAAKLPDGDAARVYGCMRYSAKDLTTLQRETNLTLLALLDVLDRLKQLDLIEETGRNQYIRR